MMVVLATSCSLHAATKTHTRNDTVFFYKSWQQVFDLTPEVFLVNPYIEAETPFSIRILTDDDKAVEVLQKSGFVAVSHDGLWYANSSYLKSEFECDAYSFENLVPLYYNEKVAYITSLGDPSIKEILFAHDDEITFPIDYYYIDFKNNRVRKVTYRYLSELLEDYHDLQMRFEGMKDYKKRYMVEEFFFNYIERATDDVLRPYILDLVE